MELKNYYREAERLYVRMLYFLRTLIITKKRLPSLENSFFTNLPRSIKTQVDEISTFLLLFQQYSSYIHQSRERREAYFHPQNIKNRAAYHRPIFLFPYEVVVPLTVNQFR